MAETPAHFDRQWFAAYTIARHEKKVADMLALRGIEYFLPLSTALHQWKDRKARVATPLFPSYIFVHITDREYLNVLTVPGAVRIVGFAGRAVPLPTKEIEAIRSYLELRAEAEPCPLPGPGQKVRVTRGPLRDLVGTVVRVKNKLRIVITIKLIMRAVMLEVSPDMIEPVHSTEPVQVFDYPAAV